MSRILDTARPVWVVLCLILFTVAAMKAQCTPDPNIPQPGTYPSPIPGGTSGVLYSQTIDIVSRGDTIYLSLLTPFDSIEISTVNAPPGLNYTCAVNPIPCMYYPVSVGAQVRMCIKLDGTPTQNIGSNFSLGVILTKWVTVVGQPVALRDTTSIPFGPPVALEDRYDLLFTNVHLSPNPGSGMFYLSGESNTNKPVTLRVADLQGRTILETNPGKLGKTFEIPVDLGGQPNGLYLVQLITDKKSSTWKAMVNFW